jgi:hypothetical protein
MTSWNRTDDPDLNRLSLLQIRDMQAKHHQDHIDIHDLRPERD